MFFATHRTVVNTGAATRTARLAIGSVLRENSTPPSIMARNWRLVPLRVTHTH